MRNYGLMLVWFALAAVAGFFLGNLLPVDVFRTDPADTPERSVWSKDRVTGPSGSPPESVADSVLAEEWKWFGKVEAADPGALATLALETAAIEDSGMRAEMRRLVMERWLDFDPAAALRWAEAENSRRDYFDSLFEAWAARDRDGAIAAADALDNPGRRKHAYREICIQFANSDDPAGFLNWANGLDRDLVHRHYFGVAIANLANDDLEKARQMTGEILDDSARTEAIQALAEAWADSDPKAVIAWAATLENRDDADQAVAAILPKVAVVDPDLAWRELQQFQDPRIHRDSIANAVVEELTRSDPEAGIRWLKEHFSESTWRNGSGAIRTAVKSGPAAAMKVMDAIGEWDPGPMGGMYPRPNQLFGLKTEPDLFFVDDPGNFVAEMDSLPGKPGPKSTLRRSVVTVWASQDFPKAWEYVSAFPDPEERLKLMSVVMKQPSDWLAAWEKSESLPESIRPEFQGHLLSQIKHRNLEQAVTLYQGLPGDRQEAGQASDLAKRLSEYGMDRAIAFAESLPPGKSRGAWFRVIDAWSFKDPAGLSEWADRLDPGSIRDGAAGKLAETLRADDPEAAFAWAADIGDFTTRSSQLESVVKEWTRNDPRWAEAFLRDTALVSGEQREKLLQVVGERTGNSAPNPDPSSRP